jgi:fermentation-respiration switch protein FrsA (DUF1100 family)
MAQVDETPGGWISQTAASTGASRKNPAVRIEKNSGLSKAADSTVSRSRAILHVSADLRVPTFQGSELYALLKERGKTVRTVTYPGSPHFPRLAEQRRDVLDEVGSWLDQYNP